MGKKIDKFVLTCVLAVALYFYFEATLKNRYIAILLSVISGIMLSKLLRRISAIINNSKWRQKRNMRRKSGNILLQIACMDESAALELIRRLLQAGYQSDEPVELVLLHPALAISCEQIFLDWRLHQGKEKLVICTTGRCSDEARAFVSGLKKPEIAVVDSDILSQLIADYPEHCAGLTVVKNQPAFKILRMKYLFFNRRNVPRCLLFAFSMLAMYIFSGNSCYLLASLFLLFAALSAVHRVPRPKKLF